MQTSQGQAIAQKMRWSHSAMQTQIQQKISKSPRQKRRGTPWE